MTDSKTVVEDLAGWLTAVWDEEEAMVQAAIDDDGGQDGGFEDSFDLLTKTRKIAGPLAHEPRFGEACARMIVHNTPRRALARIAADRKILALHKPSGGECRTCCGEPYMEEYWNRPTQTETVVWKRADLAWPCPTVRLLASPYADREGFKPEWLVERQGVEQ